MIETKNPITKQKGLLGEQLLASGAVTGSQLAIALQQQTRTGEMLGEILRKLGFLSSDSLSLALANQFGAEHIDLDQLEANPDHAIMVPESMARERHVVPVHFENGVLTVAMANIYDVATISEIESRNNVTVHAVSSSLDSMQRAIVRMYEQAGSMEQMIDDCILSAVAHIGESAEAAQVAQDAPIVRLVELLLLRCIRQEATDLHIEPEQQLVRTRLRVDGMLRLGNALPNTIYHAVVARLKIIAGANIAESRQPQDGRISYTLDRRHVDIRASFFPTLFGENVVLRFLDRSRLIVGLDQLGLSDANLNDLKQALVRPHGMILVTGPTGSGKTTTLYSALNFVNSLEKNIMTIEDPVEYEIPLIRQAQVNTKAGLTFSAALRSFLRQDPDVILVGEIRDEETAELSVRAALTGHMLLSTMHTNNAAGAIPRMIEMGQSLHTLASSLVLIVAQRLYRKICPACVEAHRPDSSHLKMLGLEKSDQVYYHGKGCPKCHFSGYKGRGGLFEVLKSTPEIQNMIVKRAPYQELVHQARSQGMRTLMEDAIDKVLAGATSVEEAVRVSFEGF
ncbi:MAG TPA: ATPase, T2SS/T4P/T4SS family [Acidobacteriota bacterium]|nr:ATPase, T2SS/T4P/T4SS family [Acidobacteriota bacterium]